MTRFAHEGYPFMAFFAILTIAAYIAGARWGARWVAAVPFVLLLFMFFFFRDPERTTPRDKGVFVSAADGKIIVVRETVEEQYLKGEALQISVFMSPLDVHVNRAPCKSKVISSKHTPGGKHKAYTDEAYLHNENIASVLECLDTPEPSQILVRQVAGTVARRAVFRMKPGDLLERGERFGIIKFSSRVDLYLPKGSQAVVKPGDRVKAGETILARTI